MVAVFTGLGAGFQRGSATQLAGGLLGNGVQGRGGENISVNAATGNLVLTSRQDEFLVGRGADIGVNRTYNSLGALDDNGDHWRQNTDRRIRAASGTLNTNGSTVKRVGADGSEVTYTYHSTYVGVDRNGNNITGSYRATDGSGAHDSLVYGGGKWTWNNGDSGDREIYFGTGSYIKEQIDRDGNKVTFTYNASNQLNRVTSANGKYIQYNWSGGRIESVTNSADGGVTDYQYDGSGRLNKVVGDGYWVAYSYHGATNQVKSLTQQDGSRLDFTYDADGRVYDVHQYPGNGEPVRTTKFRYYIDEDAISATYAATDQYTIVTDPSGVQTYLYHDNTEQLTRTRLYAPDQGIDYSTYYTYDSSGNVLTVKNAEGDTTTYTYDTRGNVKTVTDAQGNQKVNSHNTKNQLIRSYYAANTEANETGEWILEHYVYDAEGHLRYTVDGDQNVTEFEYDTYGQLRFTKQYTDKEYTRTWSYQTEAGLNAWVTGLTNAQRQNTIIRENRFDALGNVVETVAWSSASSSATPTGGDGYTHTIYTHDAQGRVKTSRVSGLTTQTYTYDAMGRMISHTDQDGGTTTISFADTATQTTITSSSGLVTLKVYNKAGDLISETNSGKRVTTGTVKYKYDKNGRVRMRSEVSGGPTSNSAPWNTYYVYDKAGNMTAEVDHSGFVTEYRYDKNGRQIAQANYTRYKSTADRNAMRATLADPNNTLQAKDLRYSADQVANHHPYDIWQWTAYDSRGQVSRTVMGDGSVMAYTYDKAGRLIKTHSYVNKLSATQVANLRSGTSADAYLPTANTSKDQITRTFYNRGGQVAGTLDGNGYLTRITYDKAGRVVQTSVFGNKATNLTGTFNQVYNSVSKSSAKDSHTRNVYDGQFLRFTIDARNKVTEFKYRVGGYNTANGVVRSTIQHSATLGNLANYQLSTVKSAVAALGDKASNRTSWNVYNTRNQLVYTIDAAGSVSRMTYNTDGTVKKSYQYSVSRPTTSVPTEAEMNTWHNNNWEFTNSRITQYYYNASGQVDYMVDAEGYVTTYAYDRAGRKTSESQWSNKFSYWQADTEGEVTTVNKGTESKTRYTYQANGALSSVYDPNGTRHLYTYYANGELAWDIRAYGSGADESRVLHINDASGKRSRTRHYQGSYSDTSDAGYRKFRQTIFYYDGTGNLIRQREHQGNHTNGGVERSTYFEYDKSGNLTKQTDGEGGVTRFEYNAFGQVTKTTDPLNKITTNTYNQAGQLTRSTDALGYHTDFTYTAFGEQRTVVRDNATTTYTYDKLGRLTQTKDALNKSSHLAYDAFGNVVTYTDRRGTVTTNSYDRRGLMSSTLTAGIRTNYTHDSRGNQLTVTTAVGRAEQATTTYTYDLANGLISTKDALNKTESYVLDRRGNVLEITNKLGNKTSFVYDRIDRVTSQTDAYGNVETFKYDANGNRIEAINKLGGVTYQKYDRLNRLIETRVVDSGEYSVESVTAHTYDKNSNLIKTVEGVGQAEQRTTNFAYDALNRLVEKTGDAVTIYEDGTSGPTTNHVPTEAYKYDARNNMIESIDANDGRTIYWYDKLNRLTHQMSPEGTLTRKWYDNEGNETDIRVYSHKYTNSSYSPTGNPPSGSNNVNNYRRTVFTYDGLNRMTQSKVVDVQTASYNNGNLTISATSNDLITSYEYNGNGNVTKVTDPNGGQTVSIYDKLGRKTRQTDAGGFQTNWVYDAIGNVTRETRLGHNTGPNRITDYAYDKNGNRILEVRRDVLSFNGSTGVSATVASQGSKYSVGGIATNIIREQGDSDIEYRYNAQGQVTRKTEATGEFIDYTYDNQGRLVVEKRSAYTDHLGGSVSPQVQYYYNALDDVTRVRKLGKTNSIATSNSYYNYEAGGRLISVDDASGFTRTYRYDAKGQLVREEYVRITNGASKTEGIGYDFDKEGRVIAQGAVTYSGSTWSRGGNSLDTVNTKYNTFGDVSDRGINGKYSEKMDYDKAGRLWRTTSGDGAYKYFMHDNNGNQTLVFTSDGRNIDNKSIAQILDIWGVSSSGANANRIVTDFESDITATITEFDARNLAIEVREPEREVKIGAARSDFITKRSYNAFGEVVSETDALNNTINYTYNTMGRRIKVESPEVTVYGEDGTVITDAEYGRGNSGSSTKIRPTEDYYYDISGRLVASKDANGNLTKQVLLAGTGYAGTNALISQTIAEDGGYVTTSYDIQGNARKVTSQLGHNANGVVNEALGYTTKNTYDAMGRLTQVDHANGLISSYAYDGLGQQIKQWNNQLVISTGGGTYVPPSTSIDYQTTDYDAQGRVTSQRAFGGDITNYSYVWNTSSTHGLNTHGGWIKSTIYASANNRTSKEYANVFDQTLKTTDLGGRDTVYTYDKGGRVTTVTGAGADTQTYTYLNTGKIGKLVVSGTGYSGNVFNANNVTRTSTYGYDKTGNLTAEKLTEVATATHYGPYGSVISSSTTNKTLQNSTATYDALGRLKTWTESGSSIDRTPPASKIFEYDAQGNIRRTQSTYRDLDSQGNASTTRTVNSWYLYDSMNRIIRSDGNLIGNQIVRGYGTDIAYDKAGQRVYTVTDVVTYSGGGSYVPPTPITTTTRENYSYNKAGQLTQVRETKTTNGTLPGTGGTIRSSFTYDLLGRQTRQLDRDAAGSTNYAVDITRVYNNKSQITSETNIVRRTDGLFKTVNTTNFGAGATYALGAAVTVTSASYKNNSHQSTSKTTNTYGWYSGAVITHTLYDSNISSSSDQKGNTNYQYSKNGTLLGTNIADSRSRSVKFTVDNNGQTIRRDETDNKTGGDPHEIWYRFGGKEMGYVGNNGSTNVNYGRSITDRTTKPTTGTNAGAFRHGSANATNHAEFDQAYQAINSYKQGSGAGAYTVNGGDTLQSIAQNIYGDSSLWYKIAQSNGLSGNTALIEGQSLRLPAGVVKSSYNADTIKPYNAAEVQGDLNPTEIQPPKPKGKKCGVIGQILLVVVAVVVTAIVAPYAVGAVGSKVIGGAIAAAAGSAASQAVGVATGIQEKFSWKGVATAAISGGVGAALGPSANLLEAAAKGAAGSAISQGIGVATGLQDSFSWAGVAAAGVAAGVSFAASKALGLSKLDKNPDSATNGKYVGNSKFDLTQKGNVNLDSVTRHLARGAAGALASAATRSAIDGSSFGDNILAAIPDVIGQVIGEAIYTQCFVAGTLIHTANGLVPIEQISVGDQVLARHDSFISREVRLRPVAQTFRTEDRETMLLTVQNTDGVIEEIRTTPGHPFARDMREDEVGKHVEQSDILVDAMLLQRTQLWVLAKSLMIGDKLTDKNGNELEVIGSVRDGKMQTVYNFEVSGDHTYFVGKLGTWVHNQSSDAIEAVDENPSDKVASPQELADIIIAGNTSQKLEGRNFGGGHPNNISAYGEFVDVINYDGVADNVVHIAKSDFALAEAVDAILIEKVESSSSYKKALAARLLEQDLAYRRLGQNWDNSLASADAISNGYQSAYNASLNKDGKFRPKIFADELRALSGIYGDEGADPSLALGIKAFSEVALDATQSGEVDRHLAQVDIGFGENWEIAVRNPNQLGSATRKFARNMFVGMTSGEYMAETGDYSLYSTYNAAEKGWGSILGTSIDAISLATGIGGIAKATTSAGAKIAARQAFLTRVAGKAELGASRRIGRLSAAEAAKVTGATRGTYAHTHAEKLLKRYQRRFGDQGFRMEQSFLNGKIVPYGTKGSSRIDVLDTLTKTPFDFKFGVAGLSSKQITKARKNLPKIYRDMIEVRP